MVSSSSSSSTTSSSSSSSTIKQKHHLNQFTDSDDLLYSIGKYIRTNGMQSTTTTTLLSSIKQSKKGLKLGETTLYLNPSCLEYLNIYLSGKRVSFKVNKNELLDIQFIISMIRHLKLDSNIPEVLEKWKELDLTLFESLKVLEINYIKPALISNLLTISQFLTKISIHQSLYSLDELIVVEDETKLRQYNEVRKLNFGQTDPLEIQFKRFQELYIRNSIWSKLAILDCSFNYIPKIDSSMYSLIALEKLNLEDSWICYTFELAKQSVDTRRWSVPSVWHGVSRYQSQPDSRDRRSQQTEITTTTAMSKHRRQSTLGYILTSFFGEDMNILEIKEFYLDGNSISQNDIEFIKKNSGTRHQSLRDISITGGGGGSSGAGSGSSGSILGSAKKKSNKIKPMKEDESTPALFIAPNAKISRPDSISPVIVSPTGHKQSTILQRTVDLESVSPESGSIYYQNEAKQEDKFEEENKLLKKISDLRNEGGNAWLRILNEMEHDPDIGDAISNNLNNNNNSSNNTTTTTNQQQQQQQPLIVTTERRIIKKKIRKGKVRPRSEVIANPDSIGTSSTVSTSPKPVSPLSNQLPSSASPINTSSNNTPNYSNSPTSSSSSTATATTMSTTTTTTTSIPNEDQSAVATDKPSAQFNKNIKEEPSNPSPKVVTKIRPKSEFIGKADLQSLRESINNTVWQKEKERKPQANPNEPNHHKNETKQQINKMVDDPNSKLLCEPFFVVKYGTNTEILLELKSDLISETNPTTGSSIKTHLLNTIVFVKKYSRPMELIEITYGKDFKDGVPTDFFKDVYIMEDQQTADLLANTLRPMIKEYTMSCMDCSERYTCREEHEFSQCVKCHSKYLFFVPSPKISSQPLVITEPIPLGSNTPASFSLSTTPSSMSSSIQALLSSSQPNDQSLFGGNRIDTNDDDFNNRVYSDQNLQLHFRLNLFTGGSQETYIYMMQSNYVRYNTQEEEKSIYLLLTSKTLYLLKREKKIIGPDQGFTKVGAYSFKEIKKISIGLLYQFFRIELEDVCYVFLKRAHDPTHKFLDLLFDAAKKDGITNLEPYFRIADTMFNINLVTETKNDFQLFIMLHHRVSSSKINPRSLIVTNDKVFMCQENYIQWPLLNKNIKTTAPQFTLVKSFKITDISNLQFNAAKPTELTINFEIEGSGEGPQLWSIITSHAVEYTSTATTFIQVEQVDAEATLTASLYNGFALIGANQNSKMPFVTLLTKANPEIPFSSNNSYSITQIFSDPNKQYGSTVAVGPGTYNHSAIVVGAIGSPSENTIYIFNLNECSTTRYCDPLISFIPPVSANTKQQQTQQSNENTNTYSLIEYNRITNQTIRYPVNDHHNPISISKDCQIGTLISVGPNFIVTSCQNNLLNIKRSSAPLAICFLNFDNTTNNCTDIILWDDKFHPCQHARGQLYVTALDSDGPVVTFSYCAVCMTPSNSTLLEVQYVSAFITLNITSPTDINILSTVYNTNRTKSCPSSISINSQWIAMGYDQDGGVDLYESTNFINYTYFETIAGESAGFGAIVDMDSDLLVVSSPGNPTHQMAAYVYFYEIFRDANGSAVHIDIEASVPSLNYKTVYDYGYFISFYDDELLLISLDETQTKYAYNVYSVCPAGQEWYSQDTICKACPFGQYKMVSNPMSNTSFELCYPCPAGYYTGNITGIRTINDCKVVKCNATTQYCPDGSVWPIDNIIVDYTSVSNPNPISTDTLDFESTFYNSYPWFLVILGFSLILTISICLPWPRYNVFQAALIKILLKVNFYDWDGEDMTVEEDYLERASSSTIGINGANRSSKRGIFIRKRRTKVKPQKAVESFCSYYFLLVLGMMILFLVQFQKVNTDISIDLRAYGQASTDYDLKEPYSEIEYLKIIDSSPLQITVDIFGYSGECNLEELTLAVKGCQTPNYMGTCHYSLNATKIKLNSNVSRVEDNTNVCRFNALFDKGIEFSDTSSFAFEITPFINYFYAQRIIYNISTMNNDTLINTGNSYVSGIIQPQEFTIIRPEASISVLSMLTFMTRCNIHSSSDDFTLVRPMVERCEFDKHSYKDYSFISNSTSYMEPTDFHDSPASFVFTVNIEKSVFFRYVTTSHSVSFGQIVTVIMFAMLDVFWLIEVIVPVVQTIVALFESALDNNKRKQYDEIGTDIVNEMDPLVQELDDEDDEDASGNVRQMFQDRGRVCLAKCKHCITTKPIFYNKSVANEECDDSNLVADE
ncbi:hypothetical protein PPL_10804 [Heterostelium album PN500]|uniref:Uncharacterized protein n=1 Tax=Heterostelium pallidum (strain ATCC 26659 / Pp 5 / PN500) TaxID=670386 RepID=D3BS12_HETP5|nr:hypothetical protein PPL_10804 [Heterostelium album PN500]EFA75749.1 hypothetical protein PPL_10804 [Heterostelium album PN500]|eukprot:XP_020427883.1 hypothetical protein PPL_10804 [Heterostelium album PN500]